MKEDQDKYNGDSNFWQQADRLSTDVRKGAVIDVLVRFLDQFGKAMSVNAGRNSKEHNRKVDC
jgi:hypothetical protein